MFGYGKKLMDGARYYGKKAYNLGRKGLKYGVGAGLLIGSGYLGAKVHSSIVDDGEPGVVLKQPLIPDNERQPIEDVFSSTLGSGEFEERSRPRRQAVTNIEPVADDDGFPIMRFRE